MRLNILGTEYAVRFLEYVRQKKNQEAAGEEE